MTENPVKCRYCGAWIRFVQTDKGKLMPVDADSVQTGHEHIWDGTQLPHYRNCPDYPRPNKKDSREKEQLRLELN